MGVETTMTGPLYDGTAKAAIEEFLEDAAREVAQLGTNEIRARLGQVLENPSGHYHNRIVTDRVSSGGWHVTDGGVVYGPWLEGTSSRNKSTRFKGYQTFRRTRQWLERKAGDVAGQQLGRHLDEMGG